MKRTCKQCGKEFFISQQEIKFYKEKNLSIPKRCKECRTANKAAKNENTAATDKGALAKKNEGSVVQNKLDETKNRQTTTVDNNSDKKPVSGVKKAIYSAAAVIILAGSAVFGKGYLTTEPAATTGYVTEIKATFANDKLLNEHYEKHGKEMGFVSAKEYEEAAARVVSDSSALHKTEKEDGDDIFYLETTNEIVFVSKDTGYIRSYFCPDDGIGYFNRQ